MQEPAYRRFWPTPLLQAPNRQQASSLLFGDGHGGFTAATAQQSGLSIPGEGRGVAVGDWDHGGRPGLVIMCTNEAALVLTPRAAPSGRAFSVKLTGTPGNPDAIGARIVVHFQDGSTQAAELAAGSGYLMQSEPLAFFSYVAGREPTTIDIKWPDGTRSNQGYEAGTTRLVLTK